MADKELLTNGHKNGKSVDLEEIELIGEDHEFTSVDTPMREDAFVMDKHEKMEKVEYHFREIMDTLGLDLEDDSLKGTPYRVAKMFVNEIFSGLDPEKKPKVSNFENKYRW